MYVEICAAIFATLLVVVAALGLGSFLVRDESGGLVGCELAATRVLAGFGSLGFLLFLVGSWTWNLLTVLVVLIPPSLSVLKRLLSRTICCPSLGLTRRYWVPFFVLCVCGAAGLSLPVGNIGNDAIAYHLLGPSKWAISGKIAPVPDQSHTAFPATVEVLFAAGMLLANDRVPGLIDFAFSVILLVQIRGLTKVFSAVDASGALALNLAATMPVIMLVANTGFVDIAYACFVLAAIRLLLDRTSSTYHALVAGMFSGFALGTKYTGIMFAFLLVVVSLAYECLDGWTWKKVKSAGLILAAAAVIGCPWYVRNWLVLGSPIYPIPLALSTIFTSPSFPPAAVLRFHEYIMERGRGLGRGFQWLIALPFTFTFLTARFHGAGGIGLGPLCFAPFGGMVVGDRRKAKFAITILVLLTVAWFITQQEARFLIPVIAFAAVFAGLGAESLLRQQSKAGRLICWSAIFVSITYGTATIAYRQLEPLLSLSSGSAETDWLALGIPYFPAFNYLNRTSNVKSVLVLDMTVPVYYLHKPYIKPEGMTGELTFPALGPYLTIPQAAAHGVTHVLDIENKALGRHFQIKSSSGLKLAFSSADAHIFEIARTN